MQLSLQEWGLQCVIRYTHGKLCWPLCPLQTLKIWWWVACHFFFSAHLKIWDSCMSHTGTNPRERSQLLILLHKKVKGDTALFFLFPWHLALPIKLHQSPHLKRVTTLPSCDVLTFRKPACSKNKKLSYRRETARQLPTSRGGGLDPQSTPPPPPLATPMRMVESESHNVRTSSVPSVKCTLR